MPVTFRTRNYSNSSFDTQGDTVLFYNTGLETARVFGSLTAPVSSLNVTGLFPFTSDYAVYAGTCEGDNPNPSELDPPPAPLAIGSALVPPGGTAPIQLHLPALHLNVFSGSSSSSPGSRVNGTNNVKLWDNLCGFALRTRSTTTVSGTAGRLAHPGLPFSEYTVCVQGTVSGNTRRRIVTGVSLNEPSDITGGTVLNVYLSDSSSSSQSCP